MALWTDLVKPAALTTVGRTVVDARDAQPGTLADVFPNVAVPDVVFSWIKNGKSRDVAQYRAFDAEAAIGGTSGLEEKTARLAPLSLKKRFGELDALRRMAPNSPESVEQAANRLAAEIGQSFVRALAVHRSTALVTGKLSIVDEEGGFRQNVDFGRRPDHTATAATAWSDDAADPIADLEQWRNAFEAHTGAVPTKLKMSRTVFAAMSRNAKVRGYFGANAPTLISQENLNATLSAYGLPTIELIHAQVNGVNAFSQDHVVLAADGAGVTSWGLTKNAQDSRYGIAAGEMPGLVVAGYREDDPSIEWIIGNATVLPVLTDPDLTFSAKVLNTTGS